MSTIPHTLFGEITPEAQRAGVAQILTQHRDELLRRIHTRIGGGTRKITDTEEILSTVARRLDHLIAEGRLEAVSERQLFALIHAITDRTLLEKHKLGSRAQQRESAGHKTELDDTNQPAPHAGGTLQRVLSQVTDPVDRQILDGKARGWSYETLASELGIHEDAVRKRWSRLRQRVQETLRGT